MSETTFNVTVDLTRISCGLCGGVYAICERYRAKCEENATSWHCPYCRRGWGYVGKTAAQREREAREAAERRLANERARHDQTRAELEHTEAQRRGEKAAKTRLKKRVACGVCPCCKRSFADLRQHMASKHPKFVDDGEGGKP